MTLRKFNLLARPWPSLAVALSVLAVDQGTKFMAMFLAGDDVYAGFRQDKAQSLVGNFILLFVAYNPDGAFSVSPPSQLPGRLFYLAITVAASTFVVWLWRKRKDPVVRTGLAMVLGGGIGNLIDRLHLAHVVDFISVGIPGMSARWPTFNLADCAILYGVLVVVWGERRLVKIRDHRAARHIADPESKAPASGLPARS